MKSLGGRPKTTDKELESYLSKLEPYLKRGLSLDKACRYAQIPRSTIQRKYLEIDWFREKIEQYKIYMSLLYADIRFIQLVQIYTRIRNNEKLTKEELHVLDWLGVHCNTLKDEYGRSQKVISSNNARAANNDIPEITKVEQKEALSRIMSDYLMFTKSLSKYKNTLAS